MFLTGFSIIQKSKFVDYKSKTISNIINLFENIFYSFSPFIFQMISFHNWNYLITINKKKLR